MSFFRSYSEEFKWLFFNFDFWWIEVEFHRLIHFLVVGYVIFGHFHAVFISSAELSWLVVVHLIILGFCFDDELIAG